VTQIIIPKCLGFVNTFVKFCLQFFDLFLKLCKFLI